MKNTICFVLGLDVTKSHNYDYISAWLLSELNATRHGALRHIKS